jgi:hypothetical protein
LSSYLQRRLVDPEVKQRIEDRAAGNFQYASTVLDALAAGEIDAAELDELPRRLEVFYYRRAVQRFPTAAAYRPARTVLEVLAAARGGLTAAQLAAVTGLGVDELPSVLDAVGCFAAAPSGVWRIVHQSIADRLISQDAKEFRIDVAADRDPPRVLPEWKSNRDLRAERMSSPSAGRGHVDDAAAVIRDGCSVRNDVVGGARLDGGDTGALTAALIAARGSAHRRLGAHPENTWHGGVASAIIAAPAGAFHPATSSVFATVSARPASRPPESQRAVRGDPPPGAGSRSSVAQPTRQTRACGACSPRCWCASGCASAKGGAFGKNRRRESAHRWRSRYCHRPELLGRCRWRSGRSSPNARGFRPAGRCGRVCSTGCRVRWPADCGVSSFVCARAPAVSGCGGNRLSAV